MGQARIQKLLERSLSLNGVSIKQRVPSVLSGSPSVPIKIRLVATLRRASAAINSCFDPESIFGELRYRAPLLQFVANERAGLRRRQAGFLDLGKERFLAGRDPRP
jgi:hypothetical protein